MISDSWYFIMTGWWAGAAGALALAGVAMIADRRRARRSDPDDVGYVPWSLVLILSLIAAAVCAAVALRG